MLLFNSHSMNTSSITSDVEVRLLDDALSAMQLTRTFRAEGCRSLTSTAYHCFRIFKGTSETAGDLMHHSTHLYAGNSKYNRVPA